MSFEKAIIIMIIIMSLSGHHIKIFSAELKRSVKIIFCLLMDSLTDISAGVPRTMICIKGKEVRWLACLYINTKNCSLPIVLTATDQKPQKSLKRWYYPPWKRRYYLAAHRRLVNVLTSNSAFFIFAVLVVWFSHSRPYKMF